MDACTGYVAYWALDEQALAPEIAEMGHLIEQTWRTLEIDKDLGASMMLWLAHLLGRAMAAPLDQFGRPSYLGLLDASRASVSSSIRPARSGQDG